MHFKAHRTDEERLNDNAYSSSPLDTNPPHDPEHKNWSLRQRDRKKEIGPEFRFSTNLQIERLIDSLNKDTNKYFDNNEVLFDNKTQFNNEEALKDFKKTRQYDFIPGLRQDDYESKHDLS